MPAFLNPKRLAAIAALALVLPLTALRPVQVEAQEAEFFDFPWAYNEWTYGRQMDLSQLRYCVDARDPDWEVAAAIADTIAHGLLLEPQRYVLETSITVTEDITRLYDVMLQHCDVFMGFKLIPQNYESWVTLTRAYYQSQYVLVAANPATQALGDIPATRPLGATIGTSGHIGLLAYLRVVPAAQRWSVYPMGTDKLGLDALLNGTIDAAVVWAPTLWAEQRADTAAYGALHQIETPMQPVSFGVGALLLADQTFLRSAVDEAIVALTADGTIAQILEYYGFPATPAP